MLHDYIRNAQYFNIILISMLRHEFKDRTAKSTFNTTLFYSDDLVIILQGFMQQLFIQRLCKAHIIMSGVDAIILQVTDSCCSKIARVTKGKNSKVLSLFDLATLTNHYFLHLCLPLRHH